MLSGASIICLSAIDWDFNWQLSQEVATMLADAGNRVLFVENSGVRRPELRDMGRLRARFWNWKRSPDGIRTVRDGVDVLSPLLVPLPYSRLAGFINTRVFLRTVRSWLASNGGGPQIVITFLPTPFARSVIRHLDPQLAVYYCADRLAESSPGASRLRESENALLPEVDLVLTTSNGLQATASKLAAHAELLVCGVHCEDFARARNSNADPPAVFRDLIGPVVGFAGSIREAIDVALLARVAELAPEMNFVLVGPVMADVRALARPNVHLVGPIPGTEVARYMAAFDAGILPYTLNAFTADVMPVKLKEYLAAGLPVVSTSLSEVRDFAEAHPGVITFADDASSFAAALRKALVDTPEEVARRMKVARGYDWSQQMSRLRELMETTLAARARRATLQAQ